jgi:SAM-dependent methyltransferase
MTPARLPPPSAPQIPDPWRARSICFSVPLEAGHRVLVVGLWPSVSRSARLAGAEVLSADIRAAEPVDRDGEATAVITGGRLPVPDGAMDHVLLPQLTPPLLPLAAAELARVLRPGGWLFLGAPAVWRSGSRRGALSVRRGRALLERCGFVDVREYGIAPSLAVPRHLVPLASPVALRWYARSGFAPTSRYAAAVRWSLVRLGQRDLLLLLFPALGWTARRPPGGADPA